MDEKFMEEEVVYWQEFTKEGQLHLMGRVKHEGVVFTTAVPLDVEDGDKGREAARIVIEAGAQKLIDDREKAMAQAEEKALKYVSRDATGPDNTTAATEGDDVDENVRP